ncbi:MAG TPA: FN3 associated domain-containing protein, partial [Terracidiphilus sp.]|nr:FN3 associated domain-containing protein [Terracidiphilus sp.]
SDTLGNPRIDFLIAAVPKSEGNRIVSAFQNAHALLKNWIEEYQGWPSHDLQRLYLEGLMLNIHPAATSIRTDRARAGLGPGVTEEPVFSPQPDVSAGDKAISLRCATPGATIHFTVDGAQPLDSSPVYHAPIIMKRIPITIKAFAESPGKKDSPVVTGIFRILDGGES